MNTQGVVCMNHSVKATLERASKFKSILILEGLLVGCVVGILISAYRLALTYASTWLDVVINWVKGNSLHIFIWFIVLGILSYCVYRFVCYEPLISGSGIPQLEAELQEKINAKWWKVLISKFIGGFLCLFAGLSLGREGPSIQLGAMGAKGVSRSMKRGRSEERYLLTCGASAGLSAAFHAPLAGVMFALEEVHKHFTPTLLVSVMCSSIAADYVMSSLLGASPVFAFHLTDSLPREYYLLLILLGIILGLCGVLYNHGLLYIQSCFQKMKTSYPFIKLLIPFMLAGVFAFTMPDILKGGDALVEHLIAGKYSLNILFVLLISKFLFSAICFGSGAPGGIFFPLLVLGCLIGGIFANVAVMYFGVDPVYINNFILLSMAGYFTAIVRAPMTGIILIFEMTGSLTHLFGLSLIAITAYITADLCKCTPIYESLLARLLKKQDTIKSHDSNKVLLEFMVTYHSKINGCKLKQIELPACLIVALKRGEREFIPNGETEILFGDVLTVMSDVSQSAEVFEEMEALCASAQMFED